MSFFKVRVDGSIYSNDNEAATNSVKEAKGQEDEVDVLCKRGHEERDSGECRSGDYAYS